MYTTILIDADHTFFDFDQAEAQALKKVFQNLTNQVTEKMLADYHDINKALWQAVEEGRLKPSAVKTERFRQWLALNPYAVRPEDLGSQFIEALGQGHMFLEGAYDFLKTLKDHFKVYVITNGLKKVQEARLKASGVDQLVDGIYISEAIGHAKPDPLFFDYVLNDLGIKNKEACLVIGDSLTSDILGGIKSGLDTCWYAPSGQVSDDIVPNYHARSYSEVLNLLSLSSPVL